MTLGFRTVLFSPLVPDGSGAETVASGVRYRWRAVHPWDAGSGSGGMETQWSPLLTINGTAATRDLPITPAANGLDVEITVITDNRPVVRVDTVVVPAGSGTIDFYNTVGAEGEILVRVDRSSLTPLSVLSSADHAALVALQATVAAISGGASTLAGISDMSAFMRTVNDDTTAAAARTTLGAGTSSLAIGTSSSTAKIGDYQPAAANISDSTSVGRAVLTAADAAAARTATVSDYSTVGRNVMTAADAAAARAAIGAGTGGVSLGITAGTAAEASEVVPRTGAATKTGVLTTSSEQIIQTATLTTSPLRKDQFDSYHSPCFLFINYTTGVWPARTVPSGVSAVIWWSAGYPNAVTPPAAIDTDFWAENYPT